MVGYSTGVAALLSVVDLVASDGSTSATAKKREGHPPAQRRDAGGKGLRRNLPEEGGDEGMWPTFYPTQSSWDEPKKIFEDWTGPGWDPEWSEKKVLCEKKVSEGREVSRDRPRYREPRCRRQRARQYFPRAATHSTSPCA